MHYTQSKPQDYRKLETLGRFRWFLVVFSDGSDIIVDFDSPLTDAKPLNLMILMVLSKINEIPLYSDTKIRQMLFLA